MHACSQPVLRTGKWDMKKNCNESRLGRFDYLLHGGKKPRMNRAFMIAVVVVVFLSFFGVVSADDYWAGDPPVTELQGTVNGSVDVLYADTWKTTNPVEYDDAWANFNLAITPSSSTPLKFARLYVVMYTANMTDNWYGNFSVTLKDGTYSVYAYPVVHKALDLNYDNTTGANYSSVSGSLKTLSRVTSDYIAVVDVKDTLQGWGNPDVRVHVETWNESVRLQSGLTRFDGRIKEVKLVYGWNTTTSPQDTKYWINEGHDPITKNIGTYTDNKTSFSSVGTPSTYTARLWADYLGNTTASKPGYGKYYWNSDSTNLTYGCSGTGCYPPTTLTKGYYAGLNYWTWTNTAGPGISSTSTLMYSKTNDWYKIPLAVFTIQ
jgi:hypothetical protein